MTTENKLPQGNRRDVELFRRMLRIRLIEEAIAERYGEQEMRCPVHLSIGQEAVAVGVCAELRCDDRIVSTHRCHAHYLAKGGNFQAMLDEIYGRESGCCGGRGGSMHLFDDDAGVLASLPIVGGSIPIAAGAALAFRQAGTDQVSVGFLGDASIEEGVFHETLNFAVLMKLPVVFILENNMYACYTHLNQRQPQRPLENIGLSHGLCAHRGNGNDLGEVSELTRDAVLRARNGEGPSLLIFDTYRWREHCGPNYDNDIGYRAETEFEDWRQRCPIEADERRLMEAGLLVQGERAEMEKIIKEEIDRTFTAAKAAAFPSPETGGTLVYA